VKGRERERECERDLPPTSTLHRRILVDRVEKERERERRKKREGERKREREIFLQCQNLTVVNAVESEREGEREGDREGDKERRIEGE